MKIKFFILTLLLACLAVQVQARENRLNFSTFRALPVLHEGRIKPIDTYARLKLRELSGRDDNASEWLAESLFDPPAAAQRAVIRVSDRDLRERLGLPGDRKLFSLAELQPGLKKTEATVLSLLETPPGERTPDQQALLKLHEHAYGYLKILRSFSLLLPLDVQTQKESGDKNYLSLLKDEAALIKKLEALIKRKGTDPARYTEDEKRLAETAFGLQQLRAGGTGNNEFRVIPGPDHSLVSPWQVALEGQGSPRAADSLALWQALAESYRTHDTAGWAIAARNLKAQNQYPHFSLEIFYNAFRPFHVALCFYALALLAFSIPALRRSAAGFLAAGTAAHTFGIIARVIVLSRPPVGTLYEAVIFVALICAITGLYLYIRRANRPALLSGAVSAAALLAIAPGLLQGGESMEMLVAVLNTNFWLSTHVLCITAGYAVSISAACLAHIQLAQLARGGAERLQPMIYRFSLAALLFTAVGTALGGIWADQSWGRFWGWDPKENGALLIVLWIVWLQHGRHSGRLDTHAFIAGTAFLNVIVALAWFGVNLLNTGLHSYGFIEGIAISLALFCAAEISLIGTLWYLGRQRKKHA